jgi:hypothetical protein
MKNVREFFWYLFLFSILFVGCKDNNVELPDVELKILSSNSIDPDWQDWSDTLAVLDTPWGKPLDLGNVFTFRNTGESTNQFRISLTFQDDEINKKYCLFRVITTEDTSEVLILGNSNQITNEPNTIDFSLDANNAYSLFIINGIEDVLSSPISIDFISLDSSITEHILYHPNQMVINEPTLFIDHNDLSNLSGDSKSTKLEVTLVSEQNEYQPLVLRKTNESTSFSAYSTSSNYFQGSTNRAVETGFELYLYTIDPTQLKQ